jgi:hypothetical protein
MYAKLCFDFEYDITETVYRRLTTEEGLRLFQNDQLPDVDQEWHRLVPRKPEMY